jgi:hypothetical protein
MTTKKQTIKEALRKALFRARTTGAEAPAFQFPIKRPDIPANVIPAGAEVPVLATDTASQYAYVWSIGQQMYGAAGFPGFSYLSQLATRAEYRAFASTISTEVTREWLTVSSKNADGELDSDKIAAIEAEFKRIGLRAVIQTIAANDSYFGRGQLFIDIKGAERSAPLILHPRTVPKDSLLGVMSVEPIWTTPSAYNALDPAAPDFYKPSKWFMLGQEVHASRLLTVITRELPDILKPAYNFAGMSMSQLAQPYVDNWLRTRQSVSDLINNFSITILKTSMDQVLQGDDDGADIFDRADLFTATRSNKGVMMLDKDREEIGQVNTPLSGLHELQAQAQEHMCLQKGSLVLTRDGWVAIENIKAGVDVLTRDGYAPVEWAGVTGNTSSFVEIDTGDSLLTVTEDHPVWVENQNQFVSAKNVTGSHILLKSREWGNTVNQWRGEEGSGVIRKLVIIAIQRLAACSTEFCGKRMLGRYLSGLMSITKTVMVRTTGWKIWKYCPALIIPLNMG